MDREEFMELVYETFADEPDNVLANGIIEAADAYAEHEKAQLFCEGTTSDLIDRQAAIEALRKALYEYEDKTEKQFQEFKDLDIQDWIQHRIFVQNMNDIDRQTILNLPSAQPEPHEGHWIEVAGELECSECHTVFTDLYPDYADSVACPHCGAKMKGAQNG